MNQGLTFDPRLRKTGSQFRDPKTGRFASRPKEIAFKCRFCGEQKPLDDMNVLRRFFPPLVACRACERRIG